MESYMKMEIKKQASIWGGNQSDDQIDIRWPHVVGVRVGVGVKVSAGASTVLIWAP